MHSKNNIVELKIKIYGILSCMNEDESQRIANQSRCWI